MRAVSAIDAGSRSGEKSLALAIAVFMGITLGQLGPITQPFQVGALVDGAHRSTIECGSLMAVQTACYAVTLLVISGLIARLGLLLTAVVGTALSVAAFGVMYFVSTMVPLYCASACAGVGEGLIFAAGLSAGAAMPKPERIYGISATVAIVIAGAFMSVIPSTQRLFGPRGVFVGLCAALILLMPTLILGLRHRQSAEAHIARPSPVNTGSAALLCLLVLFGVAAGSIYTFAERMGIYVHLTHLQVGSIFTASTIAGAAGTIGAAWVSDRWGRALPLYATLIATGGACALLGGAGGYWTYAAGLTAFQIFYTASFPFQIGAAANLDPGGGLAAFAGGTHFLAWGLGAAVGGVLATYLSYPTIGIVSFALCLIAALMVPIVVRALLRIPVRGR